MEASVTRPDGEARRAAEHSAVLGGRIYVPPIRHVWKEYAWVLAVVALVTAVGVPLPEEVYEGLGLVYLLAVILLSLRVSPGPALWAGILSVAVWDYVFIPPRWGFAIAKVSDVLLLGPCLVVGLVTPQVIFWLRMKAEGEREREEHATALFQLTRALAAGKNLDEAAFASLRQLDELLGAQSALQLVEESSGVLTPHPAGSYPLDEHERAAAQAAYARHCPSGRFTDVEPDCVGYNLPLQVDDHAVGVLGVKLPPEKELTERQRELLEVFARQMALIVEREHLRAAGEREKLLAASEKLHRTLLESVSHELRTPLAVITVALDNMPDAEPALRTNLVTEARTAAGRLNRLVGNLLDQTRLESGSLKPRLIWCDARDIINAAVEATRDALVGHPVSIEVPEDFPPVRADFGLTEQALANLLLNVARHTPAGTPATVSAGLEPGGRRMCFAVADCGPGIAPALRERLFQKFARGESARPGGLGLGLSLVRGFIAAQGGEVTVGDQPGGGAILTLYLPHTAPENPPEE